MIDSPAGKHAEVEFAARTLKTRSGEGHNTIVRSASGEE
jgi:hypothetical protein